MKLNVLTQYIQTFYPKLSTFDPNFDLQELSRTLSTEIAASSSSPSKTGSDDGKVSLAIIKCLRQGMDCLLSASFKKFIDTEVKLAEGKENVRGHVRDIWMYPLKGYMDWVTMPKEQSEPIMKVAGEVLPSCPKSLVAIHGKTVKLAVDGFTVKLWDTAKATMPHIIPGVKLTQNPDASHLTLVYSDVLASVDAKEFNDFFQSEKKGLEAAIIKPTSVAHTVSLDYAPFSVCVVVRFESDAVKEFLERLNKRFEAFLKKPVSPSLHITIAILPRSL